MQGSRCKAADANALNRSRPAQRPACFALVPLLFPESPGIAAGFVGGVSTIGGIAYPLIFAGCGNIHAGYLCVAIYLFVAFILFYFWAARHERRPQEHGLFGRALIGQQA